MAAATTSHDGTGYLAFNRPRLSQNPRTTVRRWRQGRLRERGTVSDEDKVLTRVLDEATGFERAWVTGRWPRGRMWTEWPPRWVARRRGRRDPLEVVEALIAGAEPGVVAMPSGRFFGWVIGGVLPAALARTG